MHENIKVVLKCKHSGPHKSSPMFCRSLCFKNKTINWQEYFEPCINIKANIRFRQWTFDCLRFERFESGQYKRFETPKHSVGGYCQQNVKRNRWQILIKVLKTTAWLLLFFKGMVHIHTVNFYYHASNLCVSKTYCFNCGCTLLKWDILLICEMKQRVFTVLWYVF